MPARFKLVLLDENSHKIEAMGHEDVRNHWRKVFVIDIFLIITSKLPMRCTNNFVIFYIRPFWIVLYIYYKEKVK